MSASTEPTTSEDGTIRRIGVSMDPAILKRVTARRKDLNFRSRSAYLEALVRADCGMAVNPVLKRKQEITPEPKP